MVADFSSKTQAAETTCLQKKIAKLQQHNEVLENCVTRRDRSIAQLQQHNQVLLRDYTEAKAKAEKAYAELSKLEEIVKRISLEVIELRSLRSRK